MRTTEQDLKARAFLLVLDDLLNPVIRPQNGVRVSQSFAPESTPRPVDPKFDIARRTRRTKRCAFLYEPGYVVNKPLLLILGGQDSTGNIRKTMPMSAKVEPDGKLVVIPGVTHSPNLDAPEVFHEELMSFLQARFP
ncbi:MAG: alpha/beta hydrolase [Chloroflexi bacterium]|nr:alpha/beta hydrolase [Chloroflexota bacterium]